MQGYYKRNTQFQHFIKHKLFKILTLTMHGFVEKLWKFVTATYSWFDVYTLSHTAYINAVVEFLPNTR
jgi:hypothetical protein